MSTRSPLPMMTPEPAWPHSVDCSCTTERESCSQSTSSGSAVACGADVGGASGASAAVPGESSAVDTGASDVGGGACSGIEGSGAGGSAGTPSGSTTGDGTAPSAADTARPPSAEASRAGIVSDDAVSPACAAAASGNPVWVSGGSDSAERSTKPATAATATTAAATTKIARLGPRNRLAEDDALPSAGAKRRVGRCADIRRGSSFRSADQLVADWAGLRGGGSLAVRDRRGGGPVSWSSRAPSRLGGSGGCFGSGDLCNGLRWPEPRRRRSVIRTTHAAPATHFNAFAADSERRFPAHLAYISGSGVGPRRADADAPGASATPDSVRAADGCGTRRSSVSGSETSTRSAWKITEPPSRK